MDDHKDNASGPGAAPAVSPRPVHRLAPAEGQQADRDEERDNPGQTTGQDGAVGAGTNKPDVDANENVTYGAPPPDATAQDDPLPDPVPLPPGSRGKDGQTTAQR